MSLSNQQGLCQSCRRFVGQQLVCEYCGVEMPGADLRQIARWLTAVSAVLGMALLLYAGRDVRPAVVCAEDISPRLNHALVRVSGRIASKPFVNRTEDGVSYASILIDDHTGLIRVCLQGSEASVLAESRPKVGNRLEAVGVLQVKAGREPKVFVRKIRGGVAWKLSQ